MEHLKLKKLGLLTNDGKMRIPGDEATPNPPEGYRPITKEMLDMATLFIGYDEADTLRDSLCAAQEHTKELKKKLVASEEARKDAEAKATSANDLQTRLDAAELALKEKTEHTPHREVDIIKRLDKQSDRFSKHIGEMYTKNQEQEEDELLDSLRLLEMNYLLARDCLKEGRVAFERLFPHFFLKDPMLDKFEPLAKCFTGKDGPILARRQTAFENWC
ncbi:hypothetical protein QYE76_065867 [Lolium multiflorum]|uniref:Uncharacterized protein n=1 Tax=Lolium multiflorum TaxID=4521 RepID=A0AAD8WBK0_LOLMU|nr:hypothetical protein QYE76_065867 [Lolium multiflorum]